ncbi:MAG: hypothetical protein JRF33_20830 [Deltaproteobacteria bacterium]|nr:hypothetical protein [Deltaproteobacteria bacterium]
MTRLLRQRCRSTFAFLFFALLVCACSNAVGLSDGGEDAGTQDGGDADGGTGLSWPEASASFAGHQPALAIHPDGRILLAYESGGQTWLRMNPASSDEPQLLGTGVSEYGDLQAAASPDENVSLVVWRYGNGVWIDGSATDLPAAHLVDSFDVASNIRLTWTGTKPLMVMENRNAVQAWSPNPDARAPIVAPVEADRLLTAFDGMRHYGEDVSAVELDQQSILAFQPVGETGPAGSGSLASYVIARRDPNQSPYYRPEHSDTLALPDSDELNPRWIQVHDLGELGLLLSWTETSPGSMVYDVMLNRLSLDEGNRPQLNGNPVNLSGTGGQTDNSDFPVVLPTGEGRIWVAWRETSFGPRVALYDPELNREGLIAPDEELDQDGSQPISAVVDADGSLHLVAVVHPDQDAQIRYWRITLP